MHAMHVYTHTHNLSTLLSQHSTPCSQSQSSANFVQYSSLRPRGEYFWHNKVSANFPILSSPFGTQLPGPPDPFPLTSSPPQPNYPSSPPALALLYSEAQKGPTANLITLSKAKISTINSEGTREPACPYSAPPPLLY